MADDVERVALGAEEGSAVESVASANTALERYEKSGA
jgi:hypothetical protein